MPKGQSIPLTISSNRGQINMAYWANVSNRPYFVTNNVQFLIAENDADDGVDVGNIDFTIAVDVGIGSGR